MFDSSRALFGWTGEGGQISTPSLGSHGICGDHYEFASFGSFLAIAAQPLIGLTWNSNTAEPLARRSKWHAPRYCTVSQKLGREVFAYPTTQRPDLYSWSATLKRGELMSLMGRLEPESAPISKNVRTIQIRADLTKLWRIFGSFSDPQIYRFNPWM